MRKILLALSILCISCATVYAETLTLSTYYPAPFGSYDRLKLGPRALGGLVCDAANEGIMYYDSTEKKVMVCSEIFTNVWDWGQPGYWTRDDSFSPARLFPTEITDYVGIGTITPNANLQVNGSISRQGTTLLGTAAEQATQVNLGTGGSTTDGSSATISGGSINTASGNNSTIGGGTENTSTAQSSTVAGGHLNDATGDYSSVPGGMLNRAGGSLSFAAGHRAKADHSGAFVWADSTDADYVSAAVNSFNVRAGGGAFFSNNVGIGTTAPNVLLHVHSTAGGPSQMRFSNAGSGLAGGVIVGQVDTTTGQLWNKGAGSLLLGTNDSEKMRITSDGDVGIGTSTPAHLFQAQLLGVDDYIAFSDAGSGDFGLELRSPSTPGNPYIDFTNFSNVIDYDVRLRLDDNQMLDVTGGGLMVFGSRVCTQANPCVAPNHNHPAGDITGGGFGAAETPSAGSTYTVETLLKPGASGVIVANQIPSGTTPVPIYVNNIESAPELCIDIPGSCSTTQKWCTDDKEVISLDWGSEGKCITNCAEWNCGPAPTCDYDCNGIAGPSCGTHVSYNDPCDFNHTFCEVSVCVCYYSKNEQYQQGSYQSAGARCIPFP